MKTLRIFALLAMAACLALPGNAQEALHVDTAGNLTTTLNFADANGKIIGTLGAAHLPIGTTPGTVAAGNDLRFPTGTLPGVHYNDNSTSAGGSQYFSQYDAVSGTTLGESASYIFDTFGTGAVGQMGLVGRAYAGSKTAGWVVGVLGEGRSGLLGSYPASSIPLYGGNFVVASEVNHTGRSDGVEIDVAQNSNASPATAYELKTADSRFSLGLNVVSGGLYSPNTGINFQATSSGNVFVRAISIDKLAYSQKGIEIGNNGAGTSTAYPAAVAVLSYGQTAYLAQQSSSGDTGAAFQVINAAGTAGIAGIGMNGSVLFAAGTFNGNLTLTPNGSANRTINFGNGYGSEAEVFYDGGTAGRYGQGISSNGAAFQNFVPSAQFFSWGGGGDLQTDGTSQWMRLSSSTLTIPGTLSSPAALTLAPGGSDATINVASSNQIDVYLNAPTYNAIHANGPLYFEPTTGMEVYQGGNAMFWFPSGGIATGGASDPGSLGAMHLGGALIASTAKSGTFTLSSGAATVSNTAVTSGSVIHMTVKTVSGTRAGNPDIVPTAGTGFTAEAASSDSSTYNYWIED